MSADEDGLPRVTVRDAHAGLEQVLREAQWVVLRHPVAGKAAFQALVAEGRAYAATPEGQRARAVLARSRLLRRAREAWEIATFNMLDEEPTGVLPSAYVDMVMMAAGEGTLEPLLARLAAGGADDR